MGSWFISPGGELTLDILAEKIIELIEKIDVDDVLFYGSSMGGYAAIIISSLVSKSKAVAECPQIYLKKHPGSRFVCESILDRNIPIEQIEPLYYIQHSKSQHLNIICSAFDHHYAQHIMPFSEELKNKANNENLNIEFNIYIDHSYSKGHVSLRREDSIRVIEKMFDSK